MVNPGIGQEELSEKIGNVVVYISFNLGKNQENANKNGEELGI